LVAEIVSGTNNPFYDLNSDLLVNQDDLATWLGVAGVANLPWHNPYLFGDANLDGAVDELDFKVGVRAVVPTGPGGAAASGPAAATLTLKTLDSGSTQTEQ
jgi:hypothetical protein